MLSRSHDLAAYRIVAALRPGPRETIDQGDDTNSAIGATLGVV
jgi:hypothetical protein